MNRYKINLIFRRATSHDNSANNSARNSKCFKLTSRSTELATNEREEIKKQVVIYVIFRQHKLNEKQ